MGWQARGNQCATFAAVDFCCFPVCVAVLLMCLIHRKYIMTFYNKHSLRRGASVSKAAKLLVAAFAFVSPLNSQSLSQRDLSSADIGNPDNIIPPSACFISAPQDDYSAGVEHLTRSASRMEMREWPSSVRVSPDGPCIDGAPYPKQPVL